MIFAGSTEVSCRKTLGSNDFQNLDSSENSSGESEVFEASSARIGAK